MTKRIVSGVFLLVALGALGLILAGALTSGEQLIVRFLTAIIVAALGLYVISDLRLQADDSAVANAATGRTPVTSSRVTNAEAPPPNSTAAFMATVTGKKSTTASLDRTKRNGASEAAPTGQIPVISSDLEDDPASLDTASGVTDDAAEFDDEEATTTVSAVVADHDLQPLSVLEEDQSPYSQDDLEVGQWPLTPDGKILEHEESSGADEEEIDGLVAVFTKQAQQELRKQEPAMAMNGGLLQPVLVGGEVDHSSSFKLGDVFKSFDRPSATDSPDNPAGTGGPGDASIGGMNGNGSGNGSTTNGHSSNGSSSGNALTNGHSSNGNGSTNGSGSNGQSANGNGDAEVVNANGVDAFDDDAFQDDAFHNDVSESTNDVGDGSTEELSGAESQTVAQPVETPQAAATDHGATDQATSLPRPEAELEAASYAQARIIDLRLNREATHEIEAAIRSGEIDVISSLMTDGVLSSDGPISDRDVRTMVYVAFTSNELRKILLAGGSVDADPEDLDLGPVEVFSDSAPAANPELATARAALSAPEGQVTLAAATGTETSTEASVSTETTSTEDAAPEDDELASESASI